MKIWIISFALLICSCSLGAQSSSSSNDEKVQLLRQLSQVSLNDTTRLGIYFRLVQISSNEKVKSYYNDKLLEDAKRLNSSKYQCEAYLQRISNAYNQYDANQVNYWMSMLEPIALKEKLYDYYFLGRRGVIDMLMLNGEYEREIKEAQAMLNYAKSLNNNTGILSAYHCLSNVYRMTYQHKEAIEVLETAYKIAYSTDMWFTIQINNSLIATYQALIDYKKWYKWILTLDNYLQEQIKKSPKLDKELQGWKMMVAISYIEYYTSVEDMNNAERYIQIAEKYNMDNYNVYNFYHHRARYFFYYNNGMYEQALKEVDILANIHKERSPLTYSSMNFIKANILKDSNRFDESLEIYKQAFKISDSINIVFLNKQTAQLKKDYNTEQLQLEKEALKKKIQLLYLTLAVVISLIFGIFAVHAFRVRIRLKISEEEMRKMAEEMELANVAKENFLSTISTEISTPLNAVVDGALLLTTDKVIDESTRKKISQDLNRTSAELMSLINNILNLSRLEAGMMKFKKEDIEILSFIQEFTTMEVFKGKKIDTNIPDVKTTVRVNADIARLQEVFSNLCSSEENIQIKIVVNELQNLIHFTITGSNLSAEKQSRDIAMANEINRLTIENFKGHYKIDTDTRTITISIPIV